jgi:large subunit ribosomal protein L10
MVVELASALRQMPHALVMDYTGLSAGQADVLRARLEEHGARMLVVKNSLAVLALRQIGLPDAAALLQGPSAFVTGGADPAALAKSLLEWSKKDKLATVRGGLLGGAVLDLAAVQRLASLPPIQVLRALAVSAIAAPLTLFVGVLQSVLRSFVGVVKAVADKAEGARSSSPQ